MTRPKDPERLPTLFVAHGAPPLLDDAGGSPSSRHGAGSLPRPRSISMVSAHWEAAPRDARRDSAPCRWSTTSTASRALLRADLRGAGRARARRARARADAGPARDPPRTRARARSRRVRSAGRDVPRGRRPRAPDVAAERGAEGAVRARPRARAAARRGRADHRQRLHHAQPARGRLERHVARRPRWASEFDAGRQRRSRASDVDALLDYQRKGPGVRIALPTREHFVPLLVALGAAHDEESVQFPINGFWLGSLTRRSVQFG